jgi:hypothetical protein
MWTLQEWLEIRILKIPTFAHHFFAMTEKHPLLSTVLGRIMLMGVSALAMQCLRINRILPLLP